MAQSDSRLLYFQPGTTYGETPPTFTGAMALSVFDLEMTALAAEVVERQQVDSNGGRTIKPAMAAKFGTLSFSTYALASGTAGTAPAISGLLQACGTTLATVANTSNTYTPSDLNLATGFGHFKVHHGGGDFFLYGAVGNPEITYAAGQLPLFRYTFEGIYQPPADGAVIAPTYPTSALDVVVDAVNTATFNLGTTGTPVSRECSSFTLNFGNQLERIANPGGVQRVRIASREPSASVTVRRTTLVEFNPYVLAATEVENALTMIHAAAGRRQTISIPRFTYSAPSQEDNANEIFDSMDLLISHTVNSTNFFSLKFD
jgi:hypothetical protein